MLALSQNSAHDSNMRLQSVNLRPLNIACRGICSKNVPVNLDFLFKTENHAKQHLTGRTKSMIPACLQNRSRGSELNERTTLELLLRLWAVIASSSRKSRVHRLFLMSMTPVLRAAGQGLSLVSSVFSTVALSVCCVCRDALHVHWPCVV